MTKYLLHIKNDQGEEISDLRYDQLSELTSDIEYGYIDRFISDNWLKIEEIRQSEPEEKEDPISMIELYEDRKTYKIYEDRPYILEQIHNQNENITEYWLYNNQYGVKMFMFGLNNELNFKLEKDLIDEYIDQYKSDYER